VGEVVINTPAPAIAHAIHNASGIYLRTLPMTAEKIVMAMLEKDVERHAQTAAPQ
jgi:CO/xanthine dehydrogenase Mo-binding subunit